MTDRLSRRSVLRGLAVGTAIGSVGTVGAQQNDDTPGPPTRHVIGTTGTAARARARTLSMDIHRELSFGSVGEAIVGRFPEQALEALAKRPDVRYVEPDGQMQKLSQTTPWGVDRVDADKAAAAGYTGAGADVAIIDTGIDSDHPDLQDNLGTGEAFVTCDDSCGGTDCREPWDDDDSHGTHCAGIAGAVDDAEDVVGVAPGVTLHAVKVLGCDGYGSYSDIAAGIEYAADQGWDVASLSLGGDTSSYTLRDACQYAADQGTLVVAAAGNDGCSDCVLYPAAYDSVVAVGATNEYDTLASYSSTGPEVELAAPGTNVLSTVPGGLGTLSGTSMATPHVAGGGAALMAEGDTASEARDRLGNTAEDIGLSSNESGNGLLDVQTATDTLDGGDDGEGDTTVVGEVGSLTVHQQPDGTEWFSESFDESYHDPVVVMKAPSYNGTQPGHVRVRDVTGSGFEYQFEEWEYIDDKSHAEETVSYVVAEAGTHDLPDGGTLVAGTTSTTTDWTSVSFSTTFGQAPVVLSQPQTHNGFQAVVTRNRSVDAGGFEVSLQEEEALGWHRAETVGYVAVTPGSGSLDGAAYETGTTGTAVTSNPHTVTFDGSYTDPLFLADMQTTLGANTAGLRYTNLDGTSADVLVEEEQSADDETWHRTEDIGYLVVGSGTLISV